MPHAVLFATLAFVAIALLLVASWSVPLNLLVRRLAHKYPGYYKRVGQPYLSVTRKPVPNRAKRAKSWRRFAWRLQKGLPSGFPKDPFTRNLARAYRGSLRFWAAYLVLLLLLLLPFDILAVATNWQHTKSNPHANGQGDDTTEPGPSNFKASSTPGVTGSQPTNSTARTGNPETNDSVSTYTPPSPGPTPPKPVNPKLTRDDLTAALGSIAPAGQERTHKQQVCEQLIAEQQPADDLGPSPSQICTDNNLQAYDTY